MAIRKISSMGPLGQTPVGLSTMLIRLRGPGKRAARSKNRVVQPGEDQMASPLLALVPLAGAKLRYFRWVGAQVDEQVFMPGVLELKHPINRMLEF
jgi:hypothetical protein